MDAIHDHNTTQVNSLQAMYDDLEQSRAMLSAELDAAMQKQDEALHALDTIRASYESLQEQKKSSDEAKKNAASDALRDVESMVSDLPPSVANAIVRSAASQLDGAAPNWDEYPIGIDDIVVYEDYGEICNLIETKRYVHPTENNMRVLWLSRSYYNRRHS